MKGLKTAMEDDEERIGSSGKSVALGVLRHRDFQMLVRGLVCKCSRIDAYQVCAGLIGQDVPRHTNMLPSQRIRP